jgi:hypothetical protein
VWERSYCRPEACCGQDPPYGFGGGEGLRAAKGAKGAKAAKAAKGVRGRGRVFRPRLPIPVMAPKRSASTSPEPSTSSSDASSDLSSDMTHGQTPVT